jgi:UDP-N-acetylglucosamine 2-epimerase (non-hydrolysing)
MISFVLGTRPEIIKLAPLLRRCVEQKVPFELIHTGQHYDHLLDSIFFEELKLPAPTCNLHAAAPNQEEFFAKVFPLIQEALTASKPKIVVVQGDTNSAYAGAHVAHELGIPVAHVEAGLRSYDETMPEEVNRKKIDHLATRLYVPTRLQMEILKGESIDMKHCLLTGNTVADAVSEHLKIAESKPLSEDLVQLTSSPFVIITLHRPALVDDAKRLIDVLDRIDVQLRRAQLAGLFLIHPRTRKMLGETGKFSAITLHEPVGYLPMLRLLTKAKLVLTDSGGLQEETALLHVPCITLRENTERPETIEAGDTRIVGWNHSKLQAAMQDLLANEPKWKPLYEIVHPSDVILSDLKQYV